MSLFTKSECKNFRRFNNDGTFTKLYVKLLDKSFVSSHMNLHCMINGYNCTKSVNISFPLVRQCPTSIYNLVDILKLAEKKKFHIIKQRYPSEKEIALYFHKKANELDAKLSLFISNQIKYAYKKDKLKSLIMLFALYLIRGDKWVDIRGQFLHKYIYDRSIIPLPAAVKKETNKHIKLMIRTCTGEKIPYAYKEEYKMRYKIAKKMTNNFEKFDVAIKEYKKKAENLIKKTKSSSEFDTFCKKHHSVPFKLNFLQLLKETDQGYLITPELKKHLR